MKEGPTLAAIFSGQQPALKKLLVVRNLPNSGAQGSQMFPCHARLRQQPADLSAVLHGRFTPPPQKGKGYMYLQGKIQVWDP